MKEDPSKEHSLIASLLAQEGGESHWLGYSDEHGWLLLDRGIEGNEPGIGGHSTLRFLRLSDWRKVAVPRSRWHDGSIPFYRSEARHGKLVELKSLLLEWRQRRKEWTVVADWKEVPKLLYQRGATATRTPPLTTEDDLVLCLMWSNRRSERKDFEGLLQQLVNGVSPYHASRLISARRAERCAAEFYVELGMAVQDVSITQLTAADADWREFDLDVGYPIDVKNARATYGGRMHFSEHAVAEFKEERVNKQKVRLAGVRSPYFPDPHSSACAGHPEVTVLGEVSASEVEMMVKWMDDKFGHLLKVRLWSPKRLPGWIFEYPDSYYSGRRQAIELMGTLIEVGGPKHLLLGHWLVAEAFGTSFPAVHVLKVWTTELRDFFTACGLTKRCLILYAMGATLRAAMNGEDSEQLIEALRLAGNIGPGGSSTAGPFGLEDPLGYVDRFLSAFTCLGSAIKPLASQVRMFHLDGPDLLTATMNDGVRWTVLAYCGGWIEGRGRCGSSPLVLGINEHCCECKHLICDDCLFCSKDCSLGLLRPASRVPQSHLEIDPLLGQRVHDKDDAHHGERHGRRSP